MRATHLAGPCNDTSVKWDLHLEAVSQIRERFGKVQMLTRQCQVNAIVGLAGVATGTGCTGPFFLYRYSSRGVQNLATRPQSPACGPNLGNLGSFVPNFLSQIDRTPRVWHPSQVTYARGFGSSCWIAVQETHLNTKPPSTQALYVLTWKFHECCAPHYALPNPQNTNFSLGPPHTVMYTKGVCASHCNVSQDSDLSGGL